MANQSAREMLSRLPVRMANGGSIGVATSALNNIVPTYGKGATAADLLAAEERILGEIAEDPSSWDPAKAYNAILESGVTVDDALAAGVKQSTIDAIFTSGAPLPVTAFSTPRTVESAFESPIYSGQSMEQIRTGAQNYVAGLMEDGVIDEAERRELQTVATQQGATFQDMLAAGVDPSILFNVLPAKEPDPPIIVDPERPVIFPQTQTEYVPPTVYQPIDFDPSVFAPGEESLDRAFRDSPPRTEVLDQYGNLVGFDYTPAAKLLSATGSGFSWTPPTVTGRPRSLMDTGTLGRYTQGRAAQDLRQLVGGNEEAYQAFAPLLSQTGSYGGGLSRSQLFALMQQQANQQGQQEAANYQQFGTRFGARPAGTTGYSEIAAEVPMYAEDMRGVNVSTGSLNDPMTVKPVDFRYGRPYAEGGEVKKPEGSEELTAEGDTESAGMLANLLRGVKEIPSSIYGYGERLIESPVGATTQLGLDALSMGKAVKESVGDDPIGFLLDMAPVIGEIRSGMDVDKYSDLADQARAAGDTESARMYEQIVALSAAGAVPLAGMGARAAKRTAKAGIEAAETAATQSARMLDEIAPTTAQAPKIKEIREPSEDVFGPGTSRIKYIDEETGGVIEIVERPEGQAASVIEILVPEESRRQGVAKRLQQHALERHPYLFSQTSSKYAAKNAYDLGHRPYGDPNLTLEDTYRLIDENSSVNMVAMPDMPTATAQVPESPVRVPESGAPVKAQEFVNLEDRSGKFKQVYKGIYPHQGDIKTPEEMVARAERIGPSFQDQIREITNQLGLEKIETFGVKGLKSLNDKLNRNYELETITDPIRTRILINTAEEAENAARMIADKMPTVDRGFQVIPGNGYFDRKLNVMYTGPNGERLIGEIQIVTPEMVRASEGQGHRLYEVERKLIERYGGKENIPQTHIRRFENMQEAQRQLYGGVADQADPKIVEELIPKFKKGGYVAKVGKAGKS